MKLELRFFLGVWLAAGLVGCTTFQTVGDIKLATLQHEIRVGDRIEAYVEGKRYRLVVTKLDSKNIYAVDDADKDGRATMVLPLAGISELSVRRLSLVKTAEMTAAIIFTSIAFVLATCASSVSCFSR